MGTIVIYPNIGDYGSLTGQSRPNLSDFTQINRSVYDKLLIDGLMTFDGQARPDEIGTIYNGANVSDLGVAFYYFDSERLSIAYGAKRPSIYYYCGTSVTNNYYFVGSTTLQAGINYSAVPNNFLSPVGFQLGLDKIYDNIEDALLAIKVYLGLAAPITYRVTNARHSGPEYGTIGEVVNVSCSFPEGYGIVNPSTDVYVTNNGVLIPSTYSNGTLTFTMPDPS